MTHKLIQQLRNERSAQKISQGDLAGMAGTFQNHLCRLEKGIHSPTLDVLDTWANALGYELALVKKQ